MQAPSIGGVTLPRGNGAIVRMARGSSLSDFADKIDANPASMVQALFHLGEMVTATQSVSDDILELLGDEMGYKVQIVSPEDEDRELLDTFDLSYGENEGGEEDLQVRPPVVTVMGHVDHGKTKLLDAIRSSNVVDKEAGGITQHIGAYQVATHLNDVERLITFIDTPGHEAFTAMRARGSKSTDIVVLVVAADDGVMPQTVEAINHAKAAEVPIVVAINKIDKEGANPDKIRQQLTEYGLVAEEYGGDTMFVEISARQRTNIDGLLEAVLLTADAALDLRANPDMQAEGVAIEAHLDRGRGAVATVLVQRGTLHVGDSIVAGNAYGRVRAMLGDHGENVAEATPSRPVQVLGFTSVPGAGDSFMVVEEDRVARQIAERRQARTRKAQVANRRRITLETLGDALAEKKIEQLTLIIKGDNSGTVEALEDSLIKLDVGDEVNLRVVHRGVGGITQDDINLAVITDAIVIGFNVKPVRGVQELADREGVDIRYYTVIYQAIDEIEAALKGLLKPEYEEVRGRFGRDPRGLPVQQVRQHRRQHRPLGRDPPEREGPPAAERGCHQRQPDDRFAQAVQGRCHRGPRGLRVRYRTWHLEQHRGRGHHRDLRDPGKAPRLRWTDPRRAISDGRRPGRSRGNAWRARPPEFGRLPADRTDGDRRAADMYVGILELDVLLGEVDSLKYKRAVIRPIMARLRRLDVAVTEAGDPDRHRRALIGVATVSGAADQVQAVLDTCERQVAGEMEIELLTAHRRIFGPEDDR